MSGPRRELGWIHATGIVVGAIIGIGIFLTPAKVAAIAGSPGSALALWLLGGLIALCGAFSLAEVGARFPTSGGQVVALEELLGPRFAWLYGWALLVAIQTGVLVLVMFFAADNLGRALGRQWSDLGTAAVAGGMLLSLAVANLLGARHGATVQTLTTFAKLVILATLAALGSAAAGGWLEVAPATADTIEEAVQPQPVWIAGLAAVLFSYGGFHQLTWVGGEVRQPQRTMPRAILVGIIVVILSYLAANLAYFSLLRFEEVTRSTTLAADAMAAVIPGGAGRVTALALCVSAFGIANASMLTAPRVYWALAQRGLFFPAFRTLHGATGVPRAAILLQTGLALSLLLLCSVRLGTDEQGEVVTLRSIMDQLVNGVVFVDWSFHILTCCGLILLHRREGTQRGSSYRCPASPWVPGAFAAGATVALAATFLDPSVRSSSLLGVGVLLAGLALFPRVRRMQASC